LNLAKCRPWGPGIQTADQELPQFPLGLASDHAGRSISVIPTQCARRGTQRGAWRGPASSTRMRGQVGCGSGAYKFAPSTPTTIPESQVRLTLLRYCARDHPGVLRSKLQEAAQNLLALGVSKVTWEQVCLPIRLGGLGISSSNQRPHLWVSHRKCSCVKHQTSTQP